MLLSRFSSARFVESFFRRFRILCRNWLGVLFLMGLVAPLFLFFSCNSVIDLERERTMLLETDIAFSEASKQLGPADAFYAFHTEDALQLPHGSDPIQGREAIRKDMQAGVEISLTWKPKKADVARLGDLGWTWGIYRARWTDPKGEKKQSRGKYLNIWRKQPDGSWKVAVDMGNLSPLLGGE